MSCATQWTGSAANVAVYAGGVRFYRPLHIGHLVEVEARLLLHRNEQHAHQRARPLGRPGDGPTSS